MLALLLSACAALAPSAESPAPSPAETADLAPAEAAPDLSAFGAEEFMNFFCTALESDGLLGGTDPLELAEVEEPDYRLIRREGKKILLVSSQNDGLILLSAFNTFEEQKESCLRVFASALGAFSGGSFEENLETLRSSYAAMGATNTKTLFRGYARFRLVTESDESADTGGYVYFVVGKN